MTAARHVRGTRRGRPFGLGARLLLAGTVLGLAAGIAPTGAALAATSGAPAPDFSATRTLNRVHTEPDGSSVVADTRTVTVTVDRTENLRGRERVHVTWTGAHPTGGRAVSPYGDGGMLQEYPVVLLQCRGKDDASLPPSEQISPETCWTTTYYSQRYTTIAGNLAVWQHDALAAPSARGNQDTVTDWPAACLRLPSATGLVQHLLPFRAANGTVYPSCNETTTAPEAATDSALPANDMEAFTSLDGTGDVQFEVRTDQENESLGCSSTVPCSLVVIPIMGISCVDANAECRKEGSFAPGSSNFLNLTVDEAVSPHLWWSPSNWQNRFSVPLSFSLPPNVCDVLDTRKPVQFNGSELLNQATLQWAPAYCLRQDRFKFRHNRMSEAQALRLLGTGDGVAALVSDPLSSPTVPLGYAPVAVTGFAVAYAIDRPENAGELDELKLTPRLLAKLLTGSYPASYAGQAHPGLEKNPLTIAVDPEFTALNPGLASNVGEAGAALLALSIPSDVITAVSSYIAQDAAAMAFIDGADDGNGMVVNPAYRGMSLPVSDWPLLDSWVKPSKQECESQISTPYLNLVAAPVSSITTIAQGLLDAWPNTQTKCTRSTSSDPWKIGRVDRQSYGSRFMLGLVSLGDAERYGLRTAELEAPGSDTFVAAGDASLAAAVAGFRQSAPGEPFLVDYSRFGKDSYPGTMIVHTVARLSGLEAETASDVAEFIRTATTEGQTPGSANGQLPEGFLPIAATGVTGPLRSAAAAVADAIEAQTGTVGPAPTPAPTGSPPAGPSPLAVPSTSGSGSFPALAASAADPGSRPLEAPSAVAGLAAEEPSATAAPVSAGSTNVDSSVAAGAALPTALGVALAGFAGAPLLWLRSTRRRPR